MKIAHAMLLAGAVLMGLTIAYGFVIGDFFAEARELLPMPWFHVSMIDLYLGFFLFAGWIVFRERSAGRAAVWIVALLFLGNLLSCIYALRALRQSRGDWRAFWLGARTESL